MKYRIKIIFIIFWFCFLWGRIKSFGLEMKELDFSFVEFMILFNLLRIFWGLVYIFVKWGD